MPAETCMACCEALSTLEQIVEKYCEGGETTYQQVAEFAHDSARATLTKVRRTS